MKEKLLASLKTKYKNLGFGDKAFDGVADFLSKTVTKEEEIETAISGVEPLLKSFQGDIDKVRNEKDALQKQYDELKNNSKKKDDPADPPKKDDDTDEPAWFKAYREKQEAETTALKQKIEGYEKKENQASYLSKVKSKLKEKSVPESFWVKRGINIENDEQVETVISEIESDWTEFKQEQVNSGVMIDVPPSSGGGKEGAAIGKTIAEKRNKNTSDGVKGKEI